MRAAHVTASSHTAYKAGIIRMDEALHLSLDNHEDYSLYYMPTYKNGTPILKKKHLQFLKNLQTGDNLHESGTTDTCFETSSLLHHLNITQLHTIAFAIADLQDKNLINEGGDNREIAQFVRSCRNAFCLKLVKLFIRESGGLDSDLESDDEFTPPEWATVLSTQDKRTLITIGQELVMRIGAHSIAVQEDAFFHGRDTSKLDEWRFDLGRDRGLWFSIPARLEGAKLLFLCLDTLQLDDQRPMSDIFEIKTLRVMNPDDKTPQSWDIFKLDPQSDIRDIMPPEAKDQNGSTLMSLIALQRERVEKGDVTQSLQPFMKSRTVVKRPIEWAKDSLSKLVVERSANELAQTEALRNQAFTNSGGAAKNRRYLSMIEILPTIVEDDELIKTVERLGDYIRPRGIEEMMNRPGRSALCSSYANRYENDQLRYGPTISEVPEILSNLDDLISVTDIPNICNGWHLGREECVEFREWMAQNETEVDETLWEVDEEPCSPSRPYLIAKPTGPSGKNTKKMIVPTEDASLKEVPGSCLTAETRSVKLMTKGVLCRRRPTLIVEEFLVLIIHLVTPVQPLLAAPARSR
eukprot:GHVH01014702.1.p2 GENE.GHVH01014702.1~~GHVH01014702.1.p2  ORF type:complete len:579 (+),score=79.29 GHVH01014702.1:2942-4678(+)